jgi:predicted DNA-binding transcriptional regulator AlpA
MNTPRGTRYGSAQAAAYLGLSRSTLAKWRSRGEGPPWHRCGTHLVYYWQHEIDAWLDECDAHAAASQVRRCRNTSAAP